MTFTTYLVIGLIVGEMDLHINKEARSSVMSSPPVVSLLARLMMAFLWPLLVAGWFFDLFI